MDHILWEKRVLGSTGLWVTPLGIGGAYLGRVDNGIDEELGAETVLRGLELGINLIDTSPMYMGGVSERIVGAALREWARRGGLRKDIVLETKTGTRDRAHDYSYDHTMYSVDTSLKALQTDYVDIMLVHDPEDMAPILAEGGALDALVQLKEQGVIHHIGLGARPHAFHRRMMETGLGEVSLTFRDYNLLDQSAVEGVIEPAMAHGVGVFNAMITILGLLSDREPLAIARERGWPESDRRHDEARRAQTLWTWAEAHGVSLLVLNIQYCLRDRRVASTLLGFSRSARVDQNVAACFEPIPDEVWDALHQDFGL